MQEFTSRDNYKYVFSPYEQPIGHIKDGETILVETEDAFGGNVKSELDLPSKVLTNDVNPQQGPFYIEGAKPGDTLAIDILDIQSANGKAHSAISPNLGALVFQEALEPGTMEKVFEYNVQGDRVYRDDELSYPFRPFMGTMATAPRVEALSSLTPSSNGGNMDTPETKPGNTLYLPVNVPGAYFYVGDGHGGQGDGELTGFACEMAARIKLRFHVIKGKTINWPRIESPTHLMVIGSARPMEDAARIAFAELINWMVELGWQKDRAYQALGQIGEMTVANIVDTYYSMTAKVSKDFINQARKEPLTKFM